MTKVSATPVVYQVFNEFDKHGILLGITRLPGEHNNEYKQRLMDVFVNRASSTYLGLINGITRELGLSIIDTIKIVPVKDANGDTLLESPGIVFTDTKCILYSNFTSKTILETIDRFEPTGGAWTLGQLVDKINTTGYFIATLLEDGDINKRSMTIFNQSSVINIPVEALAGSGSIIVLENNNLIADTITVISENLTRRVDTESDLIQPGDYVVKLKEGVVISLGAPAPGSSIRYSYRNDEFIARSSPVIIHNLQSDDFRTKMFEQVCDDTGVECNGLPTQLGADIINELMSVFPANWGE